MYLLMDSEVGRVAGYLPSCKLRGQVIFSRGVKRQMAHSTVKSMGNFLAPEP